MRCPQCASELQEGWTNCPLCGFRVKGTTPSQAMPEADLADVDMVRDALAGEYDILEELGRGGMAIVYRARERQLEREVAVKVLPFSLAFDAEFVERFQREARTAAQLEHPNIIPIYRVGRSGRVIYFVMKFLRGQALSRVLAERGRLTPPEIRRYLIEAGRALGHAAQRGIVHRDIKPDNIMFDEFGSTVVTDFGIAKAATSQKLTGTGMSIGTPHYMSPEQARAQATDGRSDIYSLGVVAYQSLVGRVPFDGDDSFAIGYKHIMEPLPAPPLATPDERRLFAVVRRMLQKDPGERFQSCEELIGALEGHAVASEVARSSTATPRASTARASRPSAPPTAPLPPPPEFGETRRRPVAQRAAVMRPAALGRWIWIVGGLLLLGGGAGAAYHLKVGPFAGAVADSAGTAADTLGVATAPQVGAVAAADSDGPAVVSADTGPTAVIAAGGAAAGDPPPVVVYGAPRPVPAESGGLKIVGLPRGTTVMIDQMAATEAITRLAAGRHELMISAPLHQWHRDTVLIRANEVTEYRPQLVRLGEPVRAARRRAVESRAAGTCEGPGPTYNLDRVCWDQRPRPNQPPQVPVPEGVAERPTPSTLLIKVGAEGQTAEIMAGRPSSNLPFERAVLEYARRMTWAPATKDGQPVDAWVPVRFDPIGPE